MMVSKRHTYEYMLRLINLISVDSVDAFFVQVLIRLFKYSMKGWASGYTGLCLMNPTFTVTPAYAERINEVINSLTDELR